MVISLPLDKYTLYALCSVRFASIARNPQRATRNPQRATRNAQPVTRNAQPATRNA